MTQPKDPALKNNSTDSEGRINRADTVPPPPSGDAYSAATVVREAPPEVLAAIRERKKQAALAQPKLPPAPALPKGLVGVKAPSEDASSGREVLKLHDDDDEGAGPVWQASPEIVDAVRKQRDSGQPSSRRRSRSQPAPSSPPRLTPPPSKPDAAVSVTEADDVDDQAMTRLRVSPKASDGQPASGERLRESAPSQPGHPTLAQPDAEPLPLQGAPLSEPEPAVWPSPLGAPSWTTDRRLALAVVVAMLILSTAAAFWILSFAWSALR